MRRWSLLLSCRKIVGEEHPACQVTLLILQSAGKWKSTILPFFVRKDGEVVGTLFSHLVVRPPVTSLEAVLPCISGSTNCCMAAENDALEQVYLCCKCRTPTPYIMITGQFISLLPPSAIQTSDDNSVMLRNLRHIIDGYRVRVTSHAAESITYTSTSVRRVQGRNGSLATFLREANGAGREKIGSMFHSRRHS